jgi:hypothetical protein
MTVIALSFGKDGNPKGALHELADREDISGFVIIMCRTDGRYEHFRVNLDMIQQSFAVTVAQDNLMNRVKNSSE